MWAWVQAMAPTRVARQDSAPWGEASLANKRCRIHEFCAHRFARCYTQCSLPPPSRDLYQNWQQSPYHLAVGSYLAAAGLVQAAVLQARSTLLETSIGNGVRDAIHA